GLPDLHVDFELRPPPDDRSPRGPFLHADRPAPRASRPGGGGGAMTRRSAGYEIEPRNRFSDAIVSVTYEFRPANTVTFLCDVDLTEVEALRAVSGPERKRSYTAFVVKAIALALKEFPYANRRVCRLPWIPFSVARLQSFLRCD